jgi:cytoplasmic tRNA 2-thiolation protein 1
VALGAPEIVSVRLVNGPPYVLDFKLPRYARGLGSCPGAKMSAYRYGLTLWLLSVDEGIAGYRDDSLDTVKRNEKQYGIPLKIVSYKDLYGWTMDEIVKKIGTRSNCTFCGVFRRQALDRGAHMLKADKVATGHNADDIAETVILNIVRGDVPRWCLTLQRLASVLPARDGTVIHVCARVFKCVHVAVILR